MSTRSITFRAAPTAAGVSVLVPIISEPDGGPLAGLLGPELHASVQERMKSGRIDGAYKKFYALPDVGGREMVLLLGVGARAALRREYRRDDRIRSVVAIAARNFRRLGITRFAIPDLAPLGVSPERTGRLIAEGVLLGTYRFERYKSRPRLPWSAEVVVLTDHIDAVQRGLARGTALSDGTCLARDLVNTPSSDLRPLDFAEQARQLAEQHPALSLDVIDAERMAEEQMNLHLAVSRGSDAPPCVCVLTHVPPGSADDAPWDLGLVGKGVTFDAGGYDLKPSAGMRRMFCDMAGAAAVLGAMSAIAAQGLPLKVVAVMPLAENLVNGRAYRAGDIVTSRKGLTVEIANTDAEGRLLLADSLDYITTDFSPQRLIDVATLTGSVRTALGLFVSGLFTHSDDDDHDDALTERMVSTGRRCGEWLWKLPVDDDYGAQLSSKVADIVNCDVDRKSGAGAITAAVFLRRFVDFDKVGAWAHLDIAATAYMERTVIYNKVPYMPREGATGIGARLMAEVARTISG